MGLIIIIKRLLTPSLNGHFVDRFVNTQEADELLCLFSKYRQRHIPHTSHSHLADHDHHYLTSSVMGNSHSTNRWNEYNVGVIQLKWWIEEEEMSTLLDGNWW